MKLKYIKIAVVGFGLSISQISNAALIVSNFNVNSTSVYFEIAGQLDGPAQPANLSFLDIGNNTSLLNFIPPYYEAASTFSFTGTQPLSMVAVQGVGHGFFELTFDSDLSVGESLNGVFSATWLNPVINVSNIPENLNISWGGPLGSGTAQGRFSTVPEPSTLAILSLGIMGLASRRFKKQA